MVPLITQAELERVITASDLANALDCDGDGQADPDRVAEVLASATSAMRSIFGAAWPGHEAAAMILAEDPYARTCLAYIAAGIAGRVKTAFLREDGSGPWDGLETKGRQYFKDLKTGAARGVAEPLVGKSPDLRAVGITRPSVFGTSGRSDGGGGGF